jgi:hypothetical protein
MDYIDGKNFLLSTEFNKTYTLNCSSTKKYENIYSNEVCVFQHPEKEVLIVIQDLANIKNSKHPNLHSVKAYATCDNNSYLITKGIFGENIVHAYPDIKQSGILMMSTANFNAVQKFYKFVKEHWDEYYNRMLVTPKLEISTEPNGSVKTQEQILEDLGLGIQNRIVYFNTDRLKAKLNSNRLERLY